MNKKKKNGIIGMLVKVSGLFLLVYASCLGAYINGGLYSSSQIQLYGLRDFLIVTFACMIVPFIWRIVNNKKFNFEKGKKICKWNSFFVLMFLALVDILNYGGIYDVVFENIGTNLVYIVIFYFINKWLFVDENSVATEKTKNKKMAQNKSNEELRYICEKDSHYVKDEDLLSENITRDEVETKKKAIYCKNCGGKLNDDKKCTKCGKQYFRITKEFIFYIVIGILLVVLTFYVSLYMIELKKNLDNEDYQLKYKALEQQYKNLEYKLDVLTKENSYEETKSKLDFFNEDIVFVIEGHGNVYYTYDCTPGSGVIKYEDYILEHYHPLTNGEYSYKVYHREEAIRKGYKEGTC